MRTACLWRVLVLAFLACAIAPGVHAQGLADEVEAMSTSELRVRLVPLTQEELAATAEGTLSMLRSVSSELAEAIVRYESLDGSEAPDEAALEVAEVEMEALLERGASLVTRVNLVLAALEEKGGSVEAERAYVAAVSGLRPEVRSVVEEDADSEPAEAQLTDRVDQAITTVRNQPPVHERSEPWTVPIAELELELQPLQLDQIDERAMKWLELLQREMRKRIRMDIAVDQAEDAAVKSQLVERSQRQQDEVITPTVARIGALLGILDARGGETAAYRKYVRNATGQKIKWTDPAVLYAQAMAWVRSPSGGVAVGLKILQFLAVLAVFWFLSRLLSKAAAKAVKRIPNSSSLLQQFAVGAARRLTMLIGIIVALYAIGWQPTPLLAALGAAGLVVGLALQGTLSNFASGLLILAYRPYDVGDVVDAGGVFGKVERMSLVSTTVVTFDNRVMVVPNNQVWNGVITNATARSTRRVDLTFGISYTDDIGKALKAAEETVLSHPKVLKDPSPTLKVNELGDNSVNLIVRPWSLTTDYWDVYWDLMRSVKERFDAEGISIPFPQRDLHVPGRIEVSLAEGKPASVAPSPEHKPAGALVGTPTHEPGPGRVDDDDDGDPG